MTARRVGAALAALAVMGTAACGGDPDASAPPAATPDASAPAPTLEPFAGEREDNISDAVAIGRLESPRTGELWHDPVPLGVGPAILDAATDVTYLDVGDHGDADIVVAIAERFELDTYVPVIGLFEVGGGDVRFIECPSARAGDPCVPVPGDLSAGVEVDFGTFYDSLTYPSAFEIQPGYQLATGRTLRNFESWESALGDGNVLLPAPGPDKGVFDPRMAARVTTLAAYGDTDVVQLEWPAGGDLPLTNIVYGLRMPTGAIQPFASDDVPGGQYNALSWDDGEFRFASHEWDASDRVFGAGAGVCFPAHWSIESDHVDEAWVAAGTTPGDMRVWIPNGPNLTAIAVRNTMEAWSYGIDWDTGLELPYPYASIDDFLDAHALIAIQRPDGEWLVGLRPEAVNLASECV